MSTTKENILVAPCGVSCGHCPYYLAKHNPAVMEWLVSKGCDRDKLPCQGCRPQEGDITCVNNDFPAVEGTCATYACAVEHGVDFCFECQEFPCVKLQPCADFAKDLPHNLKVFNLCYIKHQGLIEWLKKYPEIMSRYFFGKIVIGKGPQMSEESKMAEDQIRHSAKLAQS